MEHDVDYSLNINLYVEVLCRYVVNYVIRYSGIGDELRVMLL